VLPGFKWALFRAEFLVVLFFLIMIFQFLVLLCPGYLSGCFFNSSGEKSSLLLFSAVGGPNFVGFLGSLQAFC
jgi:hypothetical protein